MGPLAEKAARAGIALARTDSHPLPDRGRTKIALPPTRLPLPPLPRANPRRFSGGRVDETTSNHTHREWVDMVELAQGEKGVDFRHVGGQGP